MIPMRQIPCQEFARHVVSDYTKGMLRSISRRFGRDRA